MMVQTKGLVDLIEPATSNEEVDQMLFEARWIHFSIFKEKWTKQTQKYKNKKTSGKIPWAGRN